MIPFIGEIIIVVILQTSSYTSDYRGHRQRTQSTKVYWFLSRPFSWLVGSEDLQQVPLSPDQGSRRVQEAKLRSWGVFAKRPIFAWVNGDLEPWGKVEFVMRMFSSPQIAGLISAIIVLIVIVAIGFLLEPLQKVALIPQADISLLRWWIEGSGS